jgi:hypothetical protein
MSKLTPTPVVDKNGKPTTVHKRNDDAGSFDSRLGITPTIAMNQAPAVGSHAQDNITPDASFKMELGALFAEEDIMTEYVSRSNPGKPGLGIDIYDAEGTKTEHAVI